VHCVFSVYVIVSVLLLELRAIGLNRTIIIRFEFVSLLLQHSLAHSHIYCHDRLYVMYDDYYYYHHNYYYHTQAYKEAVEKFKKENPDAAKGYTTNAWWEGEEYQKSRQRSDERAARNLQAIKDERTIEIEAIAKEWAKREYFRQCMSGAVSDESTTEEEYTKQVWDRALLEGDMKYRVAKGEVVDEAGELATFRSQQERKQQAMLKRAKEEMKAVLQEDLDDDDDEDDDDDDDEPKK